MTGPRHQGHRRPMTAAPDPGRVRLQEHFGGPQVQRPPPPAALTTVIAARPATAPATPRSRLGHRPDRHHHTVRPLVERHPFNHRARQPTGPLPYPVISHPVLPPSIGPLDSPKPRKQTGCDRGPSPHAPTDPTGERLLCRDSAFVVGLVSGYDPMSCGSWGLSDPDQLGWLRVRARHGPAATPRRRSH
jgi:hypothetical protein